MRKLFILCFGVLFLSGVLRAEEGPEHRAVYYNLQPPFVANFDVATRKMPYIKADVALRVMDEQALELIQRNEPLIRHQIVMLLSKQTHETMAESGAQEAIRLIALGKVRGVMSKEFGRSGIDDLLFTSFVIQL